MVEQQSDKPTDFPITSQQSRLTQDFGGNENPRAKDVRKGGTAEEHILGTTHGLGVYYALALSFIARLSVKILNQLISWIYVQLGRYTAAREMGIWGKTEAASQCICVR